MIHVAIGHICPVYRAGLRAVLSDAHDIAVVGDVGASEPLIALAEAHKPDIALVDGNLIDAYDTVDRLRLAGTRILVFAPSPDETVFFQFLRHGASAYESIMLPSDELVAQIRRLADGECLMTSTQLERLAPPPSTSELVQELPSSAIEQPEEIVPDPVSLSARQKQILGYIAAGYSNKEVAKALAMSDQTVKNHITVILKKMHVSDRTGAVVFALRSGILQFEALPSRQEEHTTCQHEISETSHCPSASRLTAMSA